MIVDPEPSCALEAAAGQADPRTFCRRWGLVLAEDRARLVIPKAFRSDATGCEAGWTDREVIRALDRWLVTLPPIARKAWRTALSGGYRWNSGPMRRGSSLERCMRGIVVGHAAYGRRVRSVPPLWRCRAAVERIGCLSDAPVCA